MGNIEISAYGVLIFGSLLFWMGRVSNNRQGTHPPAGDADFQTREVRHCEVALVILVFLLLLQVMGINLTALAVFGGALVLGFGLQAMLPTSSPASSFCSTAPSR